MTGHPHAIDPRSIQPIWLSVPRKLVILLVAGVAIGLVAAWLGSVVYTNGWRRLQLAYLVAFSFVLSLSLGSLFFVLIQHLTRAGWSVVVRRPAEIFAMNIVAVAVLATPIAFFVLRGDLYPWTQTAIEGDYHESMVGTSVEHSELAGSSLYVHQQLDELTLAKRPWLNPTSFLARMALFLGVWVGIAGYYFKQSRQQDRIDERFAATRRMESWAGVAVICFGFSLTFAAFDWLMSLDPHWYSTMFGVYFFAGCAVGGFAVILLAILSANRWGVMTDWISDEHRRDLGRFLFAFVFFWGYIAFSQYMLLWYANLPETTRWLAVRGASMATGYSNRWSWLLLALLVGHFVIPFLGLMSRHVKSNRTAMVCLAAWLLVMHYFDLYWLVMPELGPRLTFGLIELGTLVGVVCFWLLGASLIATQTSLVAVGDPRFGDSLRAVEMY